MDVLLPFLTLRSLLFYVYLKLNAILSNMGIVILGVSEHCIKYVLYCHGCFLSTLSKLMNFLRPSN
jgi:hypothetical protein